MQAKEQSKRRDRHDKGTRLMTPRDRMVLRWIADQYAARFDHVRQLLSREPRTTNPATAPGPQGMTTSNVGQIMRRWEREPAWVEYRRFYRDVPGWVIVTPYGMQLLEVSYSGSHVLKERTLQHLHGINCVRLDVERRHPEYHWTSERALRAEFPHRFPFRGRKGHLPDARIWTGQRTIAVEVELSPKPDQELDAILQVLLEDGGEEVPTYQTVWYFVSSATPVTIQARRAVENARFRLPEHSQRRIQLIDLEKLS